MISKTIGFRGLAYFQTHPTGDLDWLGLDGLEIHENMSGDWQRCQKADQ